MKILSYQVFHTRDSQYLEFSLNKEEYEFLTSSKVRSIVRHIVPWVDLKKTIPLVLLYHFDQFGNCKIQVNVDEPYNEKIVKGILKQYIKANILISKEANDIFDLVCRILNKERLISHMQHSNGKNKYFKYHDSRKNLQEEENSLGPIKFDKKRATDWNNHSKPPSIGERNRDIFYSGNTLDEIETESQTISTHSLKK